MRVLDCGGSAAALFVSALPTLPHDLTKVEAVITLLRSTLAKVYEKKAL